MRKIVFAALAAASIVSLSACQQDAADDTAATAAATGIDGTWKADLASAKFEGKPNELLLQNGQFNCKTCTPPYTLAADGQFHALDRPYSDSTSIKVEGDNVVVVTSRKGEQVVSTTRYTISADGKTMTTEFTDATIPNADPVTGTSNLTRVGDAPAGAHPISGSWQIAGYDNLSDAALTITFKTEGDNVAMSMPNGISYTAMVGGPAVAITGDTAGTTATITKEGDTYVETDRRDGTIVSVTRFSIGPDGKMQVVGEDPRDGSKTTWQLARQ